MTARTQTIEWLNARIDELEAANASLRQQHDSDNAVANSYHQRLGAKWMCEAIIREQRTVYRLNRNAQAFANDLERRWEDVAFWRPVDRAGTKEGGR